MTLRVNIPDLAFAAFLVALGRSPSRSRAT